MKAQLEIRVGVSHSLAGTTENAKRHPVDVMHLVVQSICVLILLIIPVHFSTPLHAASPDKNGVKRVLVVNSYHPGYSWSDGIMHGVRSVLDGEDDVEVFIEYLDTKRHIDKTYFHQIEQLIRYKYNDLGIDVIITSDDNALDFMLGMRKVFLKNVPLIFCGIDHIHPERISGYEPIYGVEESDGTRSTLDLILSIHPDTNTVFFVSDETKTGKVMLDNVRSIERSYQGIVKFDYLLNINTGELQRALQQLPQKSVVFYLSFIRDKSQKVFSVKESMKFIAKNSTVPVYCTWGFQPNTGVIGGNILNGFTQGEMSAQMAMKLLHNEDIASIPSIQKASLTYMFDYRPMRRFNIDTDMIPKDSVLYNKPFSVYEEYRWQILGVVIFVIIQTLLIFALVINIMKRRQGEKATEESEKRFRTTFEQAAVGIAHVSPDGHFLQINQKFCDIVGYTRDEMLARTFRDISHTDDLDADVKQLERLLRWDADTYSMEKRYFRKDGEIVWVNLTVSLLREDTGEPKWFVSVVEDITERKKMELMLEKGEAHLRRAQEVAN